MLSRHLTLVVLVLLLAGVASADTLYLKNGSTFSGRVVRETEQIVEFEIRGIGAQTFRKKDVLRIEKGASIFDEYDKRKAETPSGDPAALFKLAMWCQENGLRKEAKSAFRAVLKTSPDHKDARAALGYTRVEGKWMTPRDFRKYRERRKKELEAILGKMALGDPYRNPQENVCFCPPKGWAKSDSMGGLGTVFVGPNLHGVTLAIGYEVAEPADVKLFKDSVLEGLESDHGKVEVVGTDQVTDLGGKVARENVFRYGGSSDRTERHDIFFERPEGMVHVWYVCPAEDADAMSGLFSEVRASFELEKVEDSKSPGEFTFELPDDDWQRGFGAIAQQPGFAPPDFGAEFKVIGHSVNPTFILMGSESGEGQPRRLEEEFRNQMWSDTDVRLRPARDKEWKRKVSGQDALVTPFSGSFGGAIPVDGFICTFVRGDRVYIVLALNLLGSMGDKYLKQDLNKLLDSIRVG